MRHTAILLLGLGLCACSTPDPAQVQILHEGQSFGARDYRLVAPDADAPGADATLLTESLRRGLARQGYRPGGDNAPLVIQYRLTTASQPLTYPVDMPPPSSLAPRSMVAAPALEPASSPTPSASATSVRRTALTADPAPTGR